LLYLGRRPVLYRLVHGTCRQPRARACHLTSEDCCYKTPKTFPDHRGENRDHGGMKDHPVRHDASAQPTAQIVHSFRRLEAGSQIPGPLAIFASRRRRTRVDKALPCVLLICRKLHTYFASTQKSYDSVPKREQSQGLKSGNAGSSSKTTLWTTSDRSMLLLGKRCK
jgi:hypothetical protein